MKNILAFFFLLVCFNITIAQEKPIIDVHVHSFTKAGRDNSGEILPRMCFPEPCEHPPAMAKNDQDILRLTLETMENYNIVMGVLSMYGIENVYEWKKTAPDRFISGIIIGSPLYTDQKFFDFPEYPIYSDLGMIRTELEKGNLKVLGEITSQYFGYPADAPELDPLYKLASEFDVPVHIHLGGLGGSPDFPIELGNPLRLAKVLNKYPNLRIYIENASWPFLEEVTSLMYTYPNVYADLSTITWIIPRKTFHTYLKGLIENGLEKRLMFGSDAMQWPEAIELAIESVEAADFLTEGQKRDIFYNNAARFFRLSDEEIKQHHGN